MNADTLKTQAYAIRKRNLRMIFDAHHGHIGGDLSAADILTVLYFGAASVPPPGQSQHARTRS